MDNYQNADDSSMPESTPLGVLATNERLSGIEQRLEKLTGKAETTKATTYKTDQRIGLLDVDLKFLRLVAYIGLTFKSLMIVGMFFIILLLMQIRDLEVARQAPPAQQQSQP